MKKNNFKISQTDKYRNQTQLFKNIKKLAKKIFFSFINKKIDKSKVK